MRAYANQTLVIGNTPIGFDKTITHPNIYTTPCRAYGRVQGAPVLAWSSGKVPTQSVGIEADVGQFFDIREEQPIDDALFISSSSSENAVINFEFYTEMAK